MIPVKKKILLISQEMEPYTGLSEIAELAYQLPLFLNNHKCEIRILMPRFGTINERRHRLHEVVRLSGMNIIVNDDDYPLIIKVASLPNSRIQVYFLDNDEFFKRKSVFEDSEGKPFDDNIDRAVFFCKGAIETVRKFGWAPDIIHCHGWMTSLIPLYIRTAYKNDPIFQSSKIVYSLYDTINQIVPFNEFAMKASINNLEEEDLLDFQTDEVTDLHKGAIIYADAVVRGSETMNETTESHLLLSEKPVLDYTNFERGLAPVYEFYNALEVAEVS
jgi:starch synthase